MSRVLSYTISAVPSNSQYLLLFDTTYGLGLSSTSSAAEPVPGSYRKRWAHIRRVKLTTKIGAGDSVSIVFRVLTDPTGTTASAFETDPDIATSGTYTLTASTTKTLDWKLPSSDCRIYLLAGADNPASHISTIEAYDDAEPGA